MSRRSPAAADDADDLHSTVSNKPVKRRKPNGTPTRRTTAPPAAGTSAQLRAPPSEPTHAAVRPDIQVAAADIQAQGAGGASEQAMLHGQPESNRISQNAQQRIARSTAEAGQSHHNFAAGSWSSSRRERASHEGGDLNNELLDPQLRAAVAGNAASTQDRDRGIGSAKSAGSSATGSARAGLAPSAARDTTQEAESESDAEGVAGKGDADADRAAQAPPRTMKQQKRTFRSWQASLGRKFDQQMNDQYSFGFLATAHTKTYGNGSEVSIPYSTITATAAMKDKTEMVSTTPLKDNKSIAKLLAKDLPPRVSRYQLYRLLGAVFSAIVAEEQTCNAGADGRRLIENDVRLAAAQQAQEELKREKLQIEQRLRATERTAHAHYVKVRNVLIRTGYTEDQIREELGCEPENPESSHEASGGSVGHAALGR